MSLRIAVLVFALTFAVGAAFAATNGMLAFGGTVRINSAGGNPDPIMRLDFLGTSTFVTPAYREYIEANAEVVIDANGNQVLTFDVNILNFDGLTFPTPGQTPPPLFNSTNPVRVTFGLQNTGDVPVRVGRFIPQQTTGPVPFHVSGVLGRTVTPDQIITGSFTLCNMCLNTFITRNDIPMTGEGYVSLNFGFLVEYVVAPDMPVGASDDLVDIIEPALCEVF